MKTEDHKSATPQVYGYFAMLMILALVPEKLASTPIKAICKDQLHLDAAGSARLLAIVAIPGYLAFALGLCRDRFNLRRMGDRGFILIFGCVIGVVYMAIAGIPLTLDSLGAGLLLVFASQILVRAAYQALMRNTAEARLMSGRMSTTDQVMATALPFVATVTGGWLVDHHVSWRTILVIVGLGYLTLGGYGLWKPASVFQGLPEKHLEDTASFWEGVKTLAQSRAFWVAAAIWGLWTFSPGANTPLYYYMTTNLKLSEAQYSLYDSLTNLTLVPAILLFGILIKRFSLWPLLVVASILAIPQMIPLKLIHNAPQAYAAATFMGLTGGLATAAFWCVVIRACPRGLAGAGMLMAVSFGHLSMRGSDLLGGYLFGQHDFTKCVVVTTVAYLFLLPLIFLIPRELVRPRDGEKVNWSVSQ